MIAHNSVAVAAKCCMVDLAAERVCCKEARDVLETDALVYETDETVETDINQHSSHRLHSFYHVCVPHKGFPRS